MSALSAPEWNRIGRESVAATGRMPDRAEVEAIEHAAALADAFDRWRRGDLVFTHYDPKTARTHFKRPTGPVDVPGRFHPALGFEVPR